MILTEINFKDNDFDDNNILKTSSLLKILQDAAVSDAEQFGASHKNLLNDNMFFAVYRNILTVKEQIKKGIEKAYLLTFQSGHDRMKFMRSYFVYLSKPTLSDNLKKTVLETNNIDPSENAIIVCNSIWVLVDFEKRRLLRSDSLNYPVEEYEYSFPRPTKVIVETENKNPLGEFKGSDYYIDENKHVNNTVYADIISDFDSEKKSFNYFDVTYEHEILPEDTVLVYCENTEIGKKFTGLLKGNATPCFSVEIKY